MRHSVHGVHINVIDEGSGPAVLFLHGLGGCWRDWAPQLDSLAARHRVVVVEHRGHGRSEATTGRYSTALFAADAVAVCRQIGVDHAHVVGLSMGGLVAQALALAEPDFVDALVLCDTGTHMTGRMAEAFAAIVAGVRDHGFPDSHGLVTSTAEAWSARTLAERPDIVRDNQRETESTDPQAWARAAQAILDHDSRADLHRITAPTLLVYGEEDGLIIPGKAAPALLEGLPHAELVLIPDAGHLVNLEQPEAFDRALTDWFTRYPVGAPHATQRRAP
ncbi:MAG TPA: alpha/beta fold hydrolase [Acidimicrobiales bacterium]|nr:alpha/beta fold hydrolase [Acidimicrobiales bacterium]